MRYRLLEPGPHRLRNVHLLWTRPTKATDIANLPELYALFDKVRRRLARATNRTRRLYIGRSAHYDQRLPTEDRQSLSELLTRFGFEFISPESMSFREQVSAAAEAEIIVGPHGAGLTNLVFSHRNCMVLELASRVSGEASLRPWFFQLASSRGQPYGALHVERQGWLSDLEAALSATLR